MSRRTPRVRDEVGQASILIVGFAVVLAGLVAVVTDATAAYLQRSGLDTLADGAALRGADLGATGQELYTDGLDGERLALTEAPTRAAVDSYLREVGAFARYPGLSYRVGVDQATRTVTVRLQAPLELPLSVPGSPERPHVGATGSAVADLDAG